ncbi:MAG: response regulator [Candidatus Latescibacteria bacterium]|nr:response regulator [bacterium]MBD3424613.1 response regulator [Candidatus Latescibacterota bacterium]
MEDKHILVVDDEEDITELVRYNLEREGFEVTCVGTGEKALLKASKGDFDLIILDLMLPGVDGLTVCKILKNDPDTAPIPIIMLTAKGEESDIVKGLELGASDYITKPFSPRVVVARVKAVLRSVTKRGKDEDRIRVGELDIDPQRYLVKVNGKQLDLTSTEFKILYFMANRPGWVFTRNQLIDASRGDEYVVTDRSVDVHIVGIRKKLGDFGDYIQTVRGVGYRFMEI